MSSPRKIWLVVGILLMAGLVGMGATARWTSAATESNEIPVVQVKRGEFNPKIYATGELRASHLSVLGAPQIGGGFLQITHLLHTGVRVKKGDLVIELDPTELQFKFEQSQSELDQADQEIIKARADTTVQTATDKVALLKARFDLRRAELEIEKNELLSVIDAKKNQLALEQAKRALDQLEQDIKSHTASGEATIGLAQEKRHKAQLSMNQAKQSIEKMKVLAPMDGVVSKLIAEEGENVVLSFTTEAHGYGMILATPGAPSDAMRQLMSRMKEMTKTELPSFSHEWKTLPQQLVEIAPTPLASSEPKGMVKIPGGNFVFKVEGIEIEGSNDVGVDVQYPWEDAARLLRLAAQARPRVCLAPWRRLRAVGRWRSWYISSRLHLLCDMGCYSYGQPGLRSSNAAPHRHRHGRAN